MVYEYLIINNNISFNKYYMHGFRGKDDTKPRGIGDIS